jgi:hypothetical protein
LREEVQSILSLSDIAVGYYTAMRKRSRRNEQTYRLNVTDPLAMNGDQWIEMVASH